MKTYKRETAWAFGSYVLILFTWGLQEGRTDVIDVAKYLTPFAMAALTAALGADFTAKQIKK